MTEPSPESRIVRTITAGIQLESLDDLTPLEEAAGFLSKARRRFEDKGLTNLNALLAHPGLAATNLQTTTADTGGMDLSSGFMSQAQSAEDGATGILRACADPEAQSGDFYGPEMWGGFPDKLTPEPELSDAENLRIHWEGCEAAVGPFEI